MPVCCSTSVVLKNLNMSDNLFDIWFPNQGIFLIILSNVTLLLFQVMNNDKSWRGMLIKDNEGDWGVCVAVWRGMKKGVPGVAGEAIHLPHSWCNSKVVIEWCHALKDTPVFSLAYFDRHKTDQAKARNQRGPWSFCYEVFQHSHSQVTVYRFT